MNDPRLHPFLLSNVAPNTHEATFFQLKVDDLTSQISDLRSQLTKLEDQLMSYRAVLSPIRRMPAEVLGQIFSFFLPDLLQHDARDNLVDLQLVCKSWRDAARLTHSLWGALSFEDITNVSFKRVKRWYERAGGTPKSLTFSATNLYHKCSEQSSACGSALAALLVELEGTFDRLHLRYKGPKCFQNLLDCLGLAEPDSTTPQHRPLQSLKSFAIEFDLDWNDSPDFMRSMFNRFPPNITSLELHLPSKWDAGFILGGDPNDVPLPLPQNIMERLSSLTLACDWDGTYWLQAALCHSGNLETLTIDLMGGYWDYESDDPDTERILNSGILLPKVRTLLLRNVGMSSIDILCALNAPQLVELDMEFECGPELEPQWLDSQLFLSFVNRSKCDATLRTLRLRYAPIKSEELASALDSLPLLTHLSLEGIIMEPGASFVDAFDIPLSHSRVSPKLEALELLQLPPDFSKHRLFTFLEQRRPYRMHNDQPVFSNPQDSFKRLKVVYEPTTKEKQELDGSEVVEVLRKWGGVSFDIGPILYVD
ncbi:hypothetical protein MD484_g6261, partial [Candolleomyces efflorescens]